MKACKPFTTYFLTGSRTGVGGRRQGWPQLWQPLRGAEEGDDQRGGPRAGGASPASLPLLLPCPPTAKEAIKIGASQRSEITSGETRARGTCPWRNAEEERVSPGCVPCGEVEWSP